MGATATHSDRVNLIPNVPVQMSIKYLDVYPDSGNGFGASVRLKGTSNGQPAVCYIPGKAWSALKALKAAGVIANEQYDEEPTEKYSITVLMPDVTLVREQGPGQRFAELVVRAGDGASAPPAPKPAARPAPQSISIGAVPGLDAEQAQAAAVPQALVEQYRACLRTAVQLAREELTGQGIPVEGQTVQALAATLLIQMGRR